MAYRSHTVDHLACHGQDGPRAGWAGELVRLASGTSVDRRAETRSVGLEAVTRVY
jgi:hypothetical protein